MSRLLLGRDTVIVWPAVEQVSDRGTPLLVPSSDGVVVRGLMQPVSSLDVPAQGQQIITDYRFLCRDFPAGPFARVLWGGREFDVMGEPARRNGSARSRHVTVALRARNTYPVGG